MTAALRTIFFRLKFLWMKFAHALGWLNTRILLTIVYVLLFIIPALVLKIIRKDLLSKNFNPSAQTYWTFKERTEHTVENAKHQF